MNTQQQQNYAYSFTTSKAPDAVFSLLLDIEKWWSGLYAEQTTGKSEHLNDEFTFSAGGGMHYSKQKLIELIPDKRIIWLVTESKLTFLQDTNEWANTKIGFDITSDGATTTVTFTHEGLVPQIECYEGCSGAWTKYLDKLKEKLQ